MIVLITGASHTGKTVLAQKLLEQYKYPYLSIDHLKMGLIRSGYTTLTPEDDNELTDYMWPIIREMIKTVIENGQNLIVEGCYIPFDWQKDFEKEYLDNIRYYCLVMSENYIKNHFNNIKKYASIVENRIDDDWCTMESVLNDNAQFLELAQKNSINYVLIDAVYKIEIDLLDRHDCMIDKAEYNDLQKILKLQYLSYQSEAALFGSKDIPPLKQTLNEIIDEFNNGIILKMVVDNKIIGSVRAKEQNGTVYIGKLMVHPDYRYKGYGSRLLAEIESYFPNKRYELFTSTRSKDNIRLYQKMRYTIFDCKVVNDELQFVYMEK